MTFFRRIVFLLVAACFTSVLAQENACTAVIQQAMSAVQTDCAAAGRNQACYGYFSLESTARAGVENYSFSQQGDLVNVADLETLHLSALDAANHTWGIVLMKLQANLPDALPGQNVAFVLFGSVDVQNAVAPASAPQVVSFSVNTNVRSGPSPDYRVVGSLGSGDTAMANGRTLDGTWLRIQLPDSETQGWIFANAVTSNGDLSQLSVVGATDSEVAYQPMQAFYFQTGIGQTNCVGAPQDGILIQTPSGVGTINLRANDVDIQLGSTAFLQAQPGGSLTISVLEGRALVTADGKTATVPAGSQTTVPIDLTLHVAGRPGQVTPYDATLMALLPIQLLPEQITIAPPASQEAISAANLPTFSVPGVGGTGIIGDVSLLVTLPLDQFCARMDQAIGQANTNRTNYLELLSSAAAAASGSTQAQLTQVKDMLSTCP